MKWHVVLRILSTLGDLLLLNLLFLGTSVFTLGMGIGASWTALIATHCGFASDDTGYYVRTYWKHFRTNFIMATGIFWVLVAMVGLSSLSTFFLLSRPNSVGVVLLIGGNLFIGLLLMALLPYAMAIVATRHTTLGQALRLAAFMTVRHAGWTLVQCLALAVAIVLPVYVSFAFTMIIFSLVTLGQARLIMHLWRTHTHDFNPPRS
jgi:uncharacterized membrane protein YesL